MPPNLGGDDGGASDTLHQIIQVLHIPLNMSSPFPWTARGNMESYNQLELFRHRLPPKVLCTDNLEDGLQYAYVQTAVRRRYIQPNSPSILATMPFDVDIPLGGTSYYFDDRDVPAPNMSAENPENLHAHLFYLLEIPVSLYRDETGQKRTPAKYAAAVEYALMRKLDADPSYTGHTCKNPLHPYWNVRVYQNYAYTLGELADYLDLGKVDARRRSEDYGFGRNCTLFDHLRRYAYRQVKEYWKDRVHGFEAFYDDLEVKAAFSNNNLFGTDNCLFFPEVKHIVKSISTWTWENFTPETFIARQRARGIKSGIARAAIASQRKQRFLDFMNERGEVTNKQIADHLGVTERTVRSYKKEAETLSTPDMVRFHPLDSNPQTVE